MTTSRDPEKPSSGAKSRSAKAARTPLSRRLRYLVQDSRYAVKKAGRKVAGPVRDARPKRAERTRPKAKPKPAAKPPARRPATKSDAEKPRERPAEAKRKRVGPPKRERAERPKRRRSEWPKAKRSERPKSKRGRRRVPHARRRVTRPSGARVAAAITNFGDRCSKVIRGAVAPVLPPLLGAAALGRRGLRRLAVVLTPLRAALIVAIAAAILLGVSQFVDYRGVAVGASDYAAYTDVEAVAPAPQVDREPAGSAHAYLLVPVAALSIVLLVAAARGRWQLGRVVALLGVLAIAVALIVDVPAGLDESAQAVAYSSVEAHLVEGFWVQLFSGAVLVVAGLLVSHYARRSKQGASRRSRRPARVTTPRASAA